MPNEPQWLYWDSCVFLAVLNEEQERLPTLRAILEEVGQSSGSLKLSTSILTLTEVAYVAAERDARQLDPERLEDVDALLRNDALVDLIEFNETIALRAREFIREAMSQQNRFRPADAIHLASAVYLGVTEFQTYNTADYLPLSEHITFPIKQPAPIQPRLL